MKRGALLGRRRGGGGGGGGGKRLPEVKLGMPGDSGAVKCALAPSETEKVACDAGAVATDGTDVRVAISASVDVDAESGNVPPTELDDGADAACILCGAAAPARGDNRFELKVAHNMQL
jgi:hypothetical protein